MKKFLFSLLALFLLPSFAWAGGKVFLSPGETLSLSPTLFVEEPVTYFWDITGDNISADKQNGKNFSYTFPESGTYFVSLSATDIHGKTQTTRTEIVVAEDYKKGLPLRPFLFSTPQANEDNEIFLDPQSPKALVYAKESEGNITEYHIDIDISTDTDGDGNPANDRDNKNHQSFFDGSAFPVMYRDTTSPKTAQLTLLSADGDKKSETLSFLFSEKDTTQPLQAALSSLPPSDARGDIHIFGDTAEVIFYAAESQGNILQYRLDTNITKDSNGDNKPENDIDNKTHPSFTTGEPFLHSFSRSDGNEQIVQLIAVSPEGKGSLLQRRVVFEQAQQAGFSEEKKNEMNPLLLVSASQISPEQTIDFHVVGVPNTATISWDFEGNGSIDEKGNELQKKYTYTKEGTYDAEIIVTLGDTSVIRTETITVTKPVIEIPPTDGGNTDPADENGTGDSIPPVSDFSFEQDGSRFLFSSTSQADNNVPENILSHIWDFGNGETSTEENPQIAFEKAGDYTIALTVTDSAGTQTTKEIDFSVTDKDVLKTFPEGTSSRNTPTIEIEKNGANILPVLSNTSKIDSATWDFGDGNTSSDLVPDHTYESAGEYMVRITTTDTEGNTKTVEQKIVVTQADIIASQGGVVPPKNNDTKKGGFSWLKFFLYFPLILLFLFLIGAILLLLFRKVESPDLQFEEIVHEEVERWRGKMRFVVQDDGTQIATQKVVETSPFLNVDKKEVSEVIVEEDGKKREPTVQESSSKVPAWLKNTKTDHPNEDTPKENIAQGNPVVAEEKEEKKSVVPPAPKKPQLGEKKTAETAIPQKSEVPEWLKSSDAEKKKEPQKKSEQKIPEKKKEKIISDMPAMSEEKPKIAETTEKKNLPDWLKPSEEKPVVPAPIPKKETPAPVPSKPSPVVPKQAVAQTQPAAPQQVVEKKGAPQPIFNPVGEQKQSSAPVPPKVSEQQPQQKRMPSAAQKMNALQDDENLPDWLKKTTEQAPTAKPEVQKKNISNNTPAPKKMQPVQPTFEPKPVEQKKNNVQPVQQPPRTERQVPLAGQKNVSQQVAQPTSKPVPSPVVPKQPVAQTQVHAPQNLAEGKNISPQVKPVVPQQKNISPTLVSIQKPENIQKKSISVVEKQKNILTSVSPVTHTVKKNMENQKISEQEGLSGEIDLATFPSGDGEISAEEKL